MLSEYKQHLLKFELSLLILFSLLILRYIKFHPFLLYIYIYIYVYTRTHIHNTDTLQENMIFCNGLCTSEFHFSLQIQWLWAYVKVNVISKIPTDTWKTFSYRQGRINKYIVRQLLTDISLYSTQRMQLMKKYWFKDFDKEGDYGENKYCFVLYHQAMHLLIYLYTYLYNLLIYLYSCLYKTNRCRFVKRYRCYRKIQIIILKYGLIMGGGFLCSVSKAEIAQKSPSPSRSSLNSEFFFS